MIFQIYLPLLVGVFVSVVGIIVLLKDRNNPINSIFFLFAISVGVWLFGFSAMYASHDPMHALFWAKIGFVGIVFLPVLSFHFVSVFFRKPARLLPLLYVSSIVFLLLNFSSRLLYVGVTLRPWGYYPVAGPLYFLLLIQFGLLMIRVVYLTFRAMMDQQISPIKRLQARYLFLGFGIGMFGIVDYLDKYPQVMVYPFGYICAFCFISIIAVAIVRHRLMDIRVVITKAGLLLIVFGVVLGIPFLVGRYSGRWQEATVIAVITAFLGPYLFRSVSRRADNILLATQKKYQGVLREISDVMLQEHDLGKLLQKAAGSLCREVEIKDVAIYTAGSDLEYAELRCHVGENRGKFPVHIKLDALDREDSAKSPDRDICDALGLPEEAELFFPLKEHGRIIGGLVLGHKVNARPYTDDDVADLGTFCNQLSLAMENCRYIENMRSAQEQMLRLDKLASIGGLTEGIAHQMMNRLNQFSLTAEVLARTLQREQVQNDLAGKLKEISDSLKRNVERTYDMVRGILQYGAGKHSPSLVREEFELAEILDPAIELLKIKHNVQVFPVTVHYADANRTIKGIKSQLTEVMYNLLDNAYEAILEHKASLSSDEKTSYDGAIDVELTHKLTCSEINIKDNGIGIPCEDLGKIFTISFSTKHNGKSGSGVGMYIVKRLVEEIHGGIVRIESKHGAGTSVMLSLPVK